MILATLRRIYKAFEEGDLAWLPPLLFFLGIGMAAAVNWLNKNLWGENPPLVLEGGVFAIMFFLWGIWGIYMVIRREDPILPRIIHGRLALIIGIFFIIVAWGFALLAVCRTVSLLMGFSL